jgi:hypothetical protein
MIVNNELGRICKDAVLYPILKYYGNGIKMDEIYSARNACKIFNS